MGEERGVYRVLVVKLEGKRPLGRPRRRCVDNIRMDLWGEGVYRVLVGEPEGKSSQGRPRRRWVYNFRMDLQWVGCGYMDWIGWAQNRDRWRTRVSAVVNLRVPWNAGNFLASSKPANLLKKDSALWSEQVSHLTLVPLAPRRISRPPPYPVLVNQPTSGPSSYILPRDSRGRLRSDKL